MGSCVPVDAHRAFVLSSDIIANMVREDPKADAWIGDAVLTLYARLRILKQDGTVDGDKCRRMTSNQFLSVFGDPTSLEAQLGRVYTRDGLNAAFTWIEVKLMPTFERQEENRAKRPRRP